MKRKTHTYYDSDRKKQTEAFAINAIGISLIGCIIMLILATLIR